MLPTEGVTPTSTPRIGPPTALELVYFRATDTKTDLPSIALSWETVFETGVRGYELYRSTTGNRADATLITGAIIPSRGTASVGATYELIDSDVVLGTTYTYWLEQTTIGGTKQTLATTTGNLVYSLYLPFVDG